MEIQKIEVTQEQERFPVLTILRNSDFDLLDLESLQRERYEEIKKEKNKLTPKRSQKGTHHEYNYDYRKPLRFKDVFNIGTKELSSKWIKNLCNPSQEVLNIQALYI